MQLVKYKWTADQHSGEPFLFAHDNNKTVKIKLFDEKIDILLGKRHCTGYMKNNHHFPCPKDRLVDSEKMCNECAINDDFFLCMKCTGEECLNEVQRSSCSANKYYIYLAAFNTMLKVGISYEFRLLERLIEQGADMGAKIGLVRDGKLVRVVEQSIRSELKIRDRVTGTEKHKMLFGNINVAAANISSAFNKLKSDGIAKYLISPEIYDLQNIYRLSSVKSMPRSIEVTEGLRLNGAVVAAKGNIIILETGSGLLSVNAHRLVGCDIEMN